MTPRIPWLAHAHPTVSRVIPCWPQVGDWNCQVGVRRGENGGGGQGTPELVEGERPYGLFPLTHGLFGLWPG